MNRQDIAALRSPLMVMAATFFVVTIMVLLSARIRDSNDQALSEKRATLSAARARIQNAGEEKVMIAAYRSAYATLEQSGIVGDEQRIGWLEAVQAASERARVIGIEYTLSAQRPYAYAAELKLGQLAVFESIMRLRLRLLHEEDLLRFFRALASNAGGFYTIDQCTLQRLPGELSRQRANEPNVGAECDVRWLTIKPAVAEQKKAD